MLQPHGIGSGPSGIHNSRRSSVERADSLPEPATTRIAAAENRMDDIEPGRQRQRIKPAAPKPKLGATSTLPRRRHELVHGQTQLSVGARDPSPGRSGHCRSSVSPRTEHFLQAELLRLPAHIFSVKHDSPASDVTRNAGGRILNLSIRAS